MQWFPGWRCGGSLVEDAVVPWMEMWWLIDRRCGVTLLEDVMVHGLEMWWLIGRRCGGSQIGVVVHGSLVGVVETYRWRFMNTIPDCQALTGKFYETSFINLYGYSDSRFTQSLKFETVLRYDLWEARKAIKIMHSIHGLYDVGRGGDPYSCSKKLGAKHREKPLSRTRPPSHLPTESQS